MGFLYYINGIQVDRLAVMTYLANFYNINPWVIIARVEADALEYYANTGEAMFFDNVSGVSLCRVAM